MAPPFPKKRPKPGELDAPEGLDKVPLRQPVGVGARPRGTQALPPRSQAATPLETEEEAEEAGEDAEGAAPSGSGDFGAKLARDIDAVSEQHGMSVEDGRAYAADLFGAVAECLGRAAGGGYGGGEEAEEAPMGGTGGRRGY